MQHTILEESSSSTFMYCLLYAIFLKNLRTCILPFLNFLGSERENINSLNVFISFCINNVISHKDVVVGS